MSDVTTSAHVLDRRSFLRGVPLAAASLIALTLAGCGDEGSSGKYGAAGQATTAADGLAADPAPVDQSSSSTSTSDPAADPAQSDAKAFPSFTGTDFEGNAVDNSIFEGHKLTILDFWFNGCSACVGEMPALQELDGTLQQKGGQVVGVNVEAVAGTDSLEEAKAKLASQGADYRNIMITGGDEAMDYLAGIFAFPTTVLVDGDGNIVGEPTLGSIEDPEVMADIMKVIDELC